MRDIPDGFFERIVLLLESIILIIFFNMSQQGHFKCVARIMPLN